MDRAIQGSAHALSVGQQLRAARATAGLALDEMVRRTRISHMLIEAMEGGDWRRFRGRLYAVGGVRAYALALGLPLRPILAELDIELERIWPCEPELTRAQRRPRRPLWGRAGNISLMQ